MPSASASCPGCWPACPSRTPPWRTPASCSRSPRRRAEPDAVPRSPDPVWHHGRAMKSSVKKRPIVDALPGTVGTARVDRRTRDLLPRLRPGDVAVIDHLDLDRGSAQALVDAGVVAVVDAAAIIC